MARPNPQNFTQYTVRLSVRLLRRTVLFWSTVLHSIWPGKRRGDRQEQKRNTRTSEREMQPATEFTGRNRTHTAIRSKAVLKQQGTITQIVEIQARSHKDSSVDTEYNRFETRLWKQEGLRAGQWT
jgi:hypothetical protein